MKKALLLLLTLTLSALADDESILLQRVMQLEKRVAELEKKLAPVLEEERIKAVAKHQRKIAFDRMMLDAEFLKRLDLQLIEKAYQTANKDWKAEEAKKALALLVERYPRANRTGCAVLARAQASQGEEQIQLLKQAIEQYGNCYYHTGVNVGAYARLYLGMRYKKEGNDDEAAILFEQLRAEFPDAIDQNGQLLTAHLEEL